MKPKVPSAFSPNGDAKNDVLQVGGGPYQEFQFRVYSNWGEKIFESLSQEQGWDGKYNDVDQPAGVYAWTLKCTDTQGKTHELSGDFTLVR